MLELHKTHPDRSQYGLAQVRRAFERAPAHGDLAQGLRPAHRFHGMNVRSDEVRASHDPA